MAAALAYPWLYQRLTFGRDADACTEIDVALGMPGAEDRQRERWSANHALIAAAAG